MENMEFSIEKAKKYTPELLTAVNMLLVQMNPDSAVMTEDSLNSLLAQSCYILFIAREKITGRIVGMVSLVTFSIPYGKKSRLEDLVVDESFRGKGIAKTLTKRLIEQAKQENVLYIDLTSRPMREGANQFYLKFGFFKRDTNMYRLLICKEHES